jgi:GH25 family lysozyme M1 (1,4-beta-N-acetylmuramidase)
MIGLDYASVAGNSAPDLRAAKKAGVGFVIQRGSYAAYNKHKKLFTILPDPHLARDWESHKKAKLVRGAYMFPEPRALAGVEDQVATFAGAVEEAGGLHPGDFPPVLDIEFPGGLGRGLSVAKKAVLRKAALEWMVEAAMLLEETFGVWPMLYTSARVWDGDDEDTLNADTMPEVVEALKQCPLWLARYPKGYYNTKGKMTPPEGSPPVPKMWGEGNWWAWQYHGNASKVPGFSGLVDINKFNNMRIGEKGDRVSWVQGKLGVKADGVFGPKTQAGVIEFQKSEGLKVDGVIGVGTFAQLAWEK